MNKYISIILVSTLLIVGCRRPTPQEILLAAKFSIDQACSEEYLSIDECSRANNIYDVVKNAIDHNDTGTRIALKKAIIDELNKLPNDSKVKYYFTWILLIEN